METRRLLVLLSAAAGLAYPLLWNAGLPGWAEVALKGAGVALLALAAATGAPRSGCSTMPVRCWS